MRKYIKRLFDKELEFHLKSVGAIQIVGPKWCGKSTTAKRYAKSIIDFSKNEDRNQFFPIAKQAPDVLLSYGEKPLLIDEFQVVSFLWNNLKGKIDEVGEFGQFILTGSVTDDMTSDELCGEINEKHTGTGRIIERRMRTMSLFESGDSSGEVSLMNVRNGIFTNCISDKGLKDYAFFICRGGWPLSIGVSEDVALQQARNFFIGLVTKDLFSLKDISLRKDETRARKLMKCYSRYISAECSNESIREDMKSNDDSIDKDVLNKYLLALDRLYVIEELEAWNPNLRSKTAIRSKNTRHFVDPSIAAVSLGVTSKSLFMDMRTFGFLFESLAIRDLRIYADSIGARLYHYRDKLDREADAVMVFEDGAWALLEVKLTDLDEIKAASSKLLKIANDINDKEHPKPAFLMIVTATKSAYIDENGVYVVPLSLLRN